jgi:nucleotide-binding universal stress UspA family protein
MIKLKKILYPTDFSESSLEALKYGISFAKEYGAKLTVMHVVNEQIFSEGLSLPRVVSMEDVEREMVAEAERQLKVIIPLEDRAGLDWEVVIKKGNPFLEIIRYAHEQDADLIIIGTHGRSGIEHIIFGSTAERVVRKAPCPVLSVKPSQREFVMP